MYIGLPNCFESTKSFQDATIQDATIQDATIQDATIQDNLDAY
jgi:hypothetical protein